MLGESAARPPRRPPSALRWRETMGAFAPMPPRDKGASRSGRVGGQGRATEDSCRAVASPPHTSAPLCPPLASRVSGIGIWGASPRVSRQRNAGGSPREGGKPAFGNRTVKKRSEGRATRRAQRRDGRRGREPASPASRSARPLRGPTRSAADSAARND